MEQVVSLLLGWGIGSCIGLLIILLMERRGK